jgi:ribonuclease HII
MSPERHHPPARGLPATGAGGGWLAGVDEAGRGPLAGPVVAAAVILDPARPIPGLDDSKRLGAARREALARDIRERARAWSIAWAEPAEIDAVNILQATLLAMGRAIAGLDPAPDRVLIDGCHCPPPPRPGCELRSLVGGDRLEPAISAASILAKVYRDRHMAELELHHPGYGFATHKGYPTAAHLAALAALGPSPVHRRSFAPVAAELRRRGDAA